MVRRQYIIEPEFQMRFIARFCAVVAIAAVVIAACVLWLTDNSTTVTIENTHVVVKNTVDLIYPIVFQSFVIAVILSAVVVAVLTVIMTHKIAGPLYRLKVDVERIKNGDYSANFKVRSSDQLVPFAVSLAEMSASLRKKDDLLKNEVKELKSSLESANVSDRVVLNHLQNLEKVLKI